MQFKNEVIDVGSKKIGVNQPCFIVAEIGINFNGSIDLAKKTIDAALLSGADAVKFQNYKTEDFLIDRSLTYAYTSQGKNIVESQYEMFKRNELTSKDLTELKKYCDTKKIIFFSTPTGTDTLKELVNLKVALIKNSSDYLTNLPFIKEIAACNIPAVISTGMATLSEIDEAVRTYKEAGGNNLIVLHCTSSYPTPPEDVHLRKIPSLATAFDCLVGFSDHSWGITAAMGAVTLGACLVEKHFTFDKNLPGPDHRFSSDPEEFKQLVEGIRMLEKSLGNSMIGPTASEKEPRIYFRISCTAARDLTAGELLKKEQIKFCRPGLGLAPKELDNIVGRKLKFNKRAGEYLNWSDFN